MAGTKQRMSEKELREYLKSIYPDGIFISRKPTNHGAAWIDRKTGKVILCGRKNYEIAEKVTSPNFNLEQFRNNPEAEQLSFFEIDAEKEIKTQMENMAVKAGCYLKELTEWVGEKVYVKYDKEGYPKALKTRTLIFNLKGMKER